jgi:uncharacterized protein (TIGR03067 family)
MLRNMILVFVLGSGLTLGAPAPKEVPKHNSPIVGQWQLTRVDGEIEGLKGRSSCMEIFTAEGIHIVENRVGNEVSVLRGRYAVDVNGKKDHIDFPSGNTNDVMMGIFKIEDNTLVICFQLKNGGPRPKEFKIVENELRLFEYRRVVPPK